MLEQLGAAALNRALALVVQVEKRFEASSASPNKLRERMGKGAKRIVRFAFELLLKNESHSTSSARSVLPILQN